MKKITLISVILVLLALIAAASACKPIQTTTATGKRNIVVTYSIMGSIVKELVGNEANVIVSIPNGLDPHEWEPSAKDIETLNKADLIVRNGLGLEAGMERALENAKNSGVKVFTASDYITVRHVRPGEGIPTNDPDQAVGAEDPHLWTDPTAMRDVVGALSTELMRDFDLNVSSRASDLQNRLDNINQEITNMVSALPENDRKLVTGHESMGYFAERYGFQLIGVIVPSLSSQAEVSAAGLSDLKKAIADNQVKAVFTELGTSAAIAKAIGDETGVKVVELATHTVPEDGSYFTYLRNMANVIVTALK